MRKRSKRKNNRTHFRRRSEERLGFILPEKDIIKLIQAGKLKGKRQTNRVTRFKYMHEGELYIVCYDKDRKQLITVWKALHQPKNSSIIPCEDIDGNTENNQET